MSVATGPRADNRLAVAFYGAVMPLMALALVLPRDARAKR
jgi:hypothetical protein